MKQQVYFLKNKIALCKEELFVKKVKIGDLKEMEDVAEIAVDRCRNRLIYLQNKVEKRKNMLEKVRDKLTNIEEDTINEECENIMRRLEMRNFDIGKQVSAFKTYQKTLDIKRQDLVNKLEGQTLRIIHVDKRFAAEKRKVVNLEYNILKMEK